eukprot:7136482-Prymnesium_polylepis.1
MHDSASRRWHQRVVVLQLFERVRVVAHAAPLARGWTAVAVDRIALSTEIAAQLTVLQLVLHRHCSPPMMRAAMHGATGVSTGVSQRERGEGGYYPLICPGATQARSAARQASVAQEALLVAGANCHVQNL